jgi:hypothetical protein
VSEHTCEYYPVVYGSYEEGVPEATICGAPAEVRLRLTSYNPDGSVAETFETWSCLICFDSARCDGGNYTDFDPVTDGLDDFDPEDFDPDYGPKFEILEVVKKEKQ